MTLAESCGAEVVLRQLRAAGIEHIFGIPGSTETPFLERIRANGGPSYVLGLHEGAVVSMADGYARASGSPAVVMLHTTVGSLNAMGQLYNARRNSSPVVVLAGHKDRTVLAEDGFAAIADLSAVLRNVTKWSSQCLGPEQLAGDVARALHVATTAPAGPVYLTVPVDLLEEEHRAPLPLLWPRRAQLAAAAVPSERDLAGALELLCGATRPLLVLGSRVAGCAALVAAFADAFALPVASADPADLTTYPFPSADGRYLGSYSEQRDWLARCDLVVVAGARTSFPYSGAIRPQLPPGARLVHVDSEPLDLGWDAREDCSLLGDPRAILAALTELAPGCTKADPERQLRREEARDALAVARAERRAGAARAVLGDSAQAGGDAGTLSVARLALALGAVLPPDVVVIDEALRSSRPILQALEWGASATVERNRGGALGWGVPAGVGWKLARPDRPVLVLVGDGSLQFSVQALWTAVRQGVSLVVVVLDNGGYLAVKRHIEEMIGIEDVLGGAPDPRWHPGVELEGIDHAGVARGYGAHAVEVTTADEVAAAVSDGFARGGVHLVVARVAPTWP